MAGGCNHDRFPTQASVRDDDIRSSIVYSNGLTFTLEGRLLTSNSSYAEQTFDNAHPHIGTEGYTRRYEQTEQTPEQFVRRKYPEYQTFEARVSSFRLWPIQIKQTQRQLADAGFFFTGFDDCVCCFTCGGKLRQWCIHDDPWKEHCRLFPLCVFARNQKGQDFINHMQEALDLENKENESAGNGQSSVEQQLLARADLEDMRGTFLEMGYGDFDFRKAIWHFDNLGIMHPTIYELVRAVDGENDKRERLLERQDYESSLKENRRLKSIVFCMLCGKNYVDILFLPCAHNRTCSECAALLTQCPACNRNIEEKIPTSMTRML